MTFDFTPLPLVIAVSGHSDPLPEAMKKTISDFKKHLEELIKKLPSTPIYMLNGLSVGSESYAAEAFLDVVKNYKSTNNRKPNHKLIAALPKTKLNYINDFAEGSHSNRLNKLLSQCDAIFDPSNSVGLRGIASLGKEMPEPTCHALQSVFLVRNALLHFSFCDGELINQPGGAFETTQIKKGILTQAFLTRDDLICPREEGCLVEYYTPRKQTNDIKESIYLPKTKYWKGSKIKDNLDELIPILSDKFEPINRAILNKEQREFSIFKYLPNELSALWFYSNAKANTCKRSNIRSAWICLLLGWIFTVSLADPPFQFIALLFLAFTLKFNLLTASKTKADFIQYRSLADSLIIQDLWHKLGIELDTADLIHSQTDLELDWVRGFLRSRRIQLKVRNVNAPPSLELGIKQARDWLDGKRDWLKQKIKAYKDRDILFKRLIIFFLIFSILLSYIQMTQGEVIKWYTEFFIASFLWLLACREILAYKEIIRRYQRSVEQYERSLDALNLALIHDTKDNFKDIRIKAAFESVGREKFDELNDWISSQIKRSFTPAR